MDNARYFFQDFLFENVPVDKHDFPIIDIDFASQKKHVDDYMVSLDTLLRMNKKEEWDNLFSKIAASNVGIVDDVILSNAEMDLYKSFYLKVYYVCLKRHCESCYVIT